MSVLGVGKKGWRGVGRERGGKVSHVVVVSMMAEGSILLYAAAATSSSDMISSIAMGMGVSSAKGDNDNIN